ncbi:MAG: hypothetical protein C4583_15585 [Anaerolineaceae bacterium]|nr:MAG: hypothetical protein C4583_15585 [Anaerolineaceae bacterium]
MTQERRHYSKRRFWTADEDLIVLDRTLTPAEVAARLGRPISQIYSRRDYLKNVKVDMACAAGLPVQRTIAPEEVLAERERRRQLAHRDQTASFCGDPLPGYSALDKYHQDTVSA